MASRQRRAFEEFAERAEEELGDSIQRLVLFGSVAGREEGEGSDVDVLAVVKDSRGKRKLHDIAFEVEVKYGVAISLSSRGLPRSTPRWRTPLSTGKFRGRVRRLSEVEDLVSMAREEVVDAEKMWGAGVSERKVWSSIYYSMFYAAKAALASLGFDTKTHRGVNTLVGKELYRERSLIEKEEASFFSEMRRLREDLDYTRTQFSRTGRSKEVSPWQRSSSLRWRASSSRTSE